MKIEEENLDLVLVPSGLILMFVYHLWLLYRRLYQPHTTVLGLEINDKKAWVDKIMQMDKSNIGPPLNVITASITTATFLASVSLTLCAVIGAWMANNSIFQTNLVYGDKRQSTMSIKYISLIVSFLLAFSCFVQSMRSFLHATYLISIPDTDDVPNITKYVEIAVVKGDDYWCLGHRALYFALCLLLWFLGPIPMFATSVVMVLHLHFLDTNRKPLLLHRRKSGKMAINRGGIDAVHIGSRQNESHYMEMSTR